VRLVWGLCFVFCLLVGLHVFFCDVCLFFCCFWMTFLKFFSVVVRRMLSVNVHVCLVCECVVYVIVTCDYSCVFACSVFVCMCQDRN
jgi:hypothetical protein